jgi:hypothetical protein
MTDGLNPDGSTIMKSAETAHKVQFSLSSLLEYTTICAILSAASSVMGVAATVALMLMALALWMRGGFLALIMWMTASLVVDVPWASSAGSTLLAEVTSIAIAALLVAWYYVRRRCGL